MFPPVVVVHVDPLAGIMVIWHMVPETTQKAGAVIVEIVAEPLRRKNRVVGAMVVPEVTTVCAAPDPLVGIKTCGFCRYHFPFELKMTSDATVVMMSPAASGNPVGPTIVSAPKLLKLSVGVAVVLACAATNLISSPGYGLANPDRATTYAFAAPVSVPASNGRVSPSVLRIGL